IERGRPVCVEHLACLTNHRDISIEKRSTSRHRRPRRGGRSRQDDAADVDHSTLTKTGHGRVTIPVALEPSEKVAVRLIVTPDRNSMFAKSAAKSRKVPPSSTWKLIAIVIASLSSTESSVLATPRTQALVVLSVSQVPGALLCRLSRVSVRPPVAVRVTVRVPSSSPSGPRPKLPGPTRSRSLPL